MAKHEIYFKLPERQIINSDAEFQVYSDEHKLGTLNISKGSLEWIPGGHQIGVNLSWEKFDRLMKEIKENE